MSLKIYIKIGKRKCTLLILSAVPVPGQGHFCMGSLGMQFFLCLKVNLDWPFKWLAEVEMSRSPRGGSSARSMRFHLTVLGGHCLSPHIKHPWWYIFTHIKLQDTLEAFWDYLIRNGISTQFLLWYVSLLNVMKLYSNFIQQQMFADDKKPNVWKSMDLSVNLTPLLIKVIGRTCSSTESTLKEGLDGFILNVSLWIESVDPLQT